MSRIVSKDKAVEKEYDIAPPIQLLPEDNQEILDAIDGLNRTISFLSAKVITSGGTNSKVLYEIMDAVSACNKSLTDYFSKPKKPSKWIFKIKRDSFGEMESVIATEIFD